MKKIVGLLAVTMGLVFINPVQATEVKTIAIIDTAIDSNKITNIVHEVCITYNSTCQNKTSFQEGKGSAMINDWKIRGADHGFNVVQVANQTDPNIKIVFIRIADEKVYDTFSIIRNDGGSLAKAVKWVSENASKHNISSVSISQSRSNFAAGTCPTDLVLSSAVSSLNTQNVFVFAATGNDKKTKQVGFPACVNGVIGVGSVRPDLVMASYTNVGPGLDVVARGDAKVKAYGGWDLDVVGTSVATPIAAVMSVSSIKSKTFDKFVASLPKAATYPYISK